MFDVLERIDWQEVVRASCRPDPPHNRHPPPTSTVGGAPGPAPPPGRGRNRPREWPGVPPCRRGNREGLRRLGRAPPPPLPFPTVSPGPHSAR